MFLRSRVQEDASLSVMGRVRLNPSSLLVEAVTFELVMPLQSFGWLSLCFFLFGEAQSRVTLLVPRLLHLSSFSSLHNSVHLGMTPPPLLYSNLGISLFMQAPPHSKLIVPALGNMYPEPFMVSQRLCQPSTPVPVYGISNLGPPLTVSELVVPSFSVVPKKRSRAEHTLFVLGLVHFENVPFLRSPSRVISTPLTPDYLQLEAFLPVRSTSTFNSLLIMLGPARFKLPVSVLDHLNLNAPISIQSSARVGPALFFSELALSGSAPMLRGFGHLGVAWSTRGRQNVDVPMAATDSLQMKVLLLTRSSICPGSTLLATTIT